MDGLWSRAAGELEKVHLYIYIWCCVVRGMLYCICAFSKCILGDPDVVCDILPDPFRMHNKSQPKANIPSPALHPPWQLDTERGPWPVLCCEISWSQTAFRSGKGWKWPQQSTFQLSSQSWSAAAPREHSIPSTMPGLAVGSPSCTLPYREPGKLFLFPPSLSKAPFSGLCSVLEFSLRSGSRL